MKTFKRVVGAVVLGSALTTAAPSYGALVAHWELDDGSGSIASDSAGSNHGTLRDNTSVGDGLTSGPIWVGGQIGTGSLSFDGVNDNVIHGFSLPKSQGTISHWLMTDQLRQQVAYYESNGTGSNYNGSGSASATILEAHTGLDQVNNWNFFYQDGGGSQQVILLSGPLAQVGVWTHVAATWNRAGDANLYVDGQLVDTENMMSISFNSLAASVRQFGRVGNATAARHWDGLMDDIRVYDTEFSQAQIMALIPEPGSLSLLMLSGALILRRKSR